MKLYKNYFVPEASEKPYANAGEHLADCFSCLDLFLDAFSEKGEGKAEAFFSNSGENRGQKQELAAAFTHLEKREKASEEQPVFLPAVLLKQYFRMTELEYFSYLLALAPELEGGYRRRYAQLEENGQAGPTLGLAADLFSGYAFLEPQALYSLYDGHSLLNRFCFDSRVNRGRIFDTPQRILKLKERIVMYSLGSPYIEKEIAPFCTRIGVLEKRRPPMPGSRLDLEQRLLAACRSILERQKMPVVFYLWGEQGAGRKYLLSYLAGELGITILSVDLQGLYEEPGEDFLDDVILEAGLSGGAAHFYLTGTETKEEISRFIRLLERLAEEIPLIFLSGPEENLECRPRGCVFLKVPFPDLPAGERLALWKELAGSYRLEADVDLSAIAGRYKMTPQNIRDALLHGECMRLYKGERAISKECLTRAILELRPLSFEHLAEKIPVIYDWRDMELEERQKELLSMAVNRFRFRELVGEEWGFSKKGYYSGLSLLFYGPPGTGKTMAAQVLAGELGLELYRVDISQISSKYIGETEKNLGRIFDEAEKGNVILFFDEADALFSKRTEVKNANDRYANAQTSYLLQRIERYEGVVILATNLFHNFDDAFIRRLACAIRFERPDKEARLRLFQKILPGEAGVSPELDLRFFAERFELSGSAIKSVLYNAACLAAGEDSRMENRHLVRALKYEFMKMGNIISDEDFGQYSIYLEERGNRRKIID